MSKKHIRWKKGPEGSDYDGAVRYLSLLFSNRDVHSLIKALKHSKPLSFEAKDLLRASDLPLLSREEPKVAKDLQRIHKGKSIPPVLLVRADSVGNAKLIVADGYHRICAVTLFDEDELVKCHLVDPPTSRAD